MVRGPAGRRALSVVALLFLGGCAFVARASKPAQPVEVSASTQSADITPDARWVVFQSSATNLVAGDTNQRTDIFRADRQTGVIDRVSLTDADGEATGGALGAVTTNPSISDDGRYVAFQSSTTNLVPGDTNNASDIFVRDTLLGTTTRVSVSSAEVQATGLSRFPQISGDATTVVFDSLASNLVASDTNAVRDVFARDLVAGTTERVSVDNAAVQSNGESQQPITNVDGDIVAFRSVGTNLVAGDTNGVSDVFVHERSSDVTELGSRTSSGGFPNSLSGQVGGYGLSRDGRWLAFTSNGDNVMPGVSGGEAYLLDRDTGVLDLVSRTTAGVEGNTVSGAGPIGVSDDGQLVAFVSLASNFAAGDGLLTVDVFVRDRAAATLTLVSRTAASSTTPVQSALQSATTSGDGALIVWSSTAAGVVTGDTNGTADVFLFDRAAGTNSRVLAGAQGNGASGLTDQSSDGRYVAFVSDASNLVPGDTNAVADVFVRDMVTKAVERVSVDSAEQQASATSLEGTYDDGSRPAISADGDLVVFTTAAQLGAGDTNTVFDIYVRDRSAGTTTLITTHNPAACGSFCFTGNATDPDLTDDGNHLAFISSGTDMSWSNDSVAVDAFGGPTAYLYHMTGTGYPASFDPSFPLAYNDVTAVAVGDTETRMSTVWVSTAQGTHSTSELVIPPGVTVKQLSTTPVSNPRLGGIRYVTFDTGSALVGGDTNLLPDVYLLDRDTDADDVLDEAGSTSIERISVATGGAQGNGGSSHADVTTNGRYATFASQATNLVGDDTNGVGDVFVRDRTTGRTWRVSLEQLGGEANGTTHHPRITPSGQYVSFDSVATDLDPAGTDLNGERDAFLKAALIPDISGIAPGSGARGTSVPITISGAGFLPGAQVLTSNNGITVSNVAVVGDTTITATLGISAGAATGPVTLLVAHPGGVLGFTAGAADACVLCFTVT